MATFTAVFTIVAEILALTESVASSRAGRTCSCRSGETRNVKEESSVSY
jgi:hypothetical protein